jgi:SAM-dependent methyltransferase
VQEGTDWPYDPQAVRAQLEQSSVLVESYHVDVVDFQHWCQAASYADFYSDSPAHTEKLLEHYLSLQLLPPITSQSVIVDVACAGSPFAAAVQRLYGCVTCRQDLVYPEGIHRASDGIEEIGGNAAFMPLPDSFASELVSHCAFEMFQGNNDSLLIQEAARVLQPSGHLVIIPLYLSSLHHHLVDPLADRRGVSYDPGARIVYRPDFYRVASARFYSVEAFMRRVVTYRSGLSLKVIFVENEKEVDSSCYLKFAAIFERPAEQKAATSPKG